MKKAELLELFDIFKIPMPEWDDPTVAEIKEYLEENGITNETLDSWNKKKDVELEEDGDADYSDFVEAADGSVVICMDRKNPSYSIGRYVFTQAKRYLPVDKEAADQILKNHTGFHKATKEELKANFKL